MTRNGVHVALARRWFWSLVGVAVLAMGALYRSFTAEPGPAAGLVVLFSGLLLAASTAQAARIWLALAPPRQQARQLVGARFRRRTSPTR